MRTKNLRPQVITVPIEFHRLNAVLAVQRRQIQDFCGALPVSKRHAWFVLTGARRGSAGLLDAVRRELGEPAWQFVCGQVDVLHDEGGEHDPA